MTSPASWIPPATLYPLGWTLIHFLWQGAALAAAAAAAMALCRQSSARYLIGVASLSLMLAAPLITFFMLGREPAPAFFLPLRGLINAPLPPTWLMPGLVDGWAMGVALLSLRFGGSFAVLGWHYHHQTHEAGPRLLALCGQVEQRLGITRVIRYLECNWLEAPAGFGALRPVILFPAAALTGLSQDQLRAVIAHELAHIRRWDFAVNLFQVMAETLLFYHPAVWWLNRRIRAEREICCDEIAMAAYGNRIEYARALALLAEWKHVPALAMAASHGLLADRVRRLLRADVQDARPLFAPLAASLLLVMLSLAAAQFLRPQQPAPQMTAVPRPERIAREMPQAIPASGFIADIVQHKVIVRPRLHLSVALIAWPSLPAAAVPEAAVEASFIPVADTPAPPPSPPRVTPMQARDLYPASTLTLTPPYMFPEWERPQASNYCDDYAQATVTQGANRPLLVDDAAKARYSFFYWQCFMRSGFVQGGPGLYSPDYMPEGAASADQPVHVAGTWAVGFTPFPPTRSCSFTQDGNILTGTCSRPQGSGAAHGVVDGKQVRWVWTYLDDEKLPSEIDFIGVMGTDGAIRGQYIQSFDHRPTYRIQPFTAHPGALNAQLASQN